LLLLMTPGLNLDQMVSCKTIRICFKKITEFTNNNEVSKY
jgi:hypothetical protein